MALLLALPLSSFLATIFCVLLKGIAAIPSVVLLVSWHGLSTDAPHRVVSDKARSTVQRPLRPNASPITNADVKKQLLSTRASSSPSDLAQYASYSALYSNPCFLDYNTAPSNSTAAMDLVKDWATFLSTTAKRGSVPPVVQRSGGDFASRPTRFGADPLTQERRYNLHMAGASDTEARKHPLLVFSRLLAPPRDECLRFVEPPPSASQPDFVWIIVGVVAGCVLFAILIGLLVVMIRRRGGAQSNVAQPKGYYQFGAAARTQPMPGVVSDGEQ